VPEMRLSVVGEACMTLWPVCPRTSTVMNPGRERIDLGREPCRTVKVAGRSAGDYWIEEDGRPMTPSAAVLAVMEG